MSCYLIDRIGLKVDSSYSSYETLNFFKKRLIQAIQLFQFKDKFTNSICAEFEFVSKLFEP